MSRKKRSTRRKWWWGILGVLLLALVILGIIFFTFYGKFFSPNVADFVKNDQAFFVPTGSTFEEVKDDLIAHHILLDTSSFDFVAGFMKYKSHVKPGRYLLQPGMSNRQLIQTLRSGNTPIQLVVNKKRTKAAFAGYVSQKIEADSGTLLSLLNDTQYTEELGFTTDNILTMFIPNTYELWWNTDSQDFLARMKSEFDQFWNAERRAQLNKLSVPLTPQEAIILASIVEEETAKDDEKPIVAGLYLNRLKKGMKLQADPTVKFALQDFAKKRVYTADTKIAHPYNTYHIKGLPPGPICIPYRSSMEAVLHAADHDYIFMCAKADFSGYHAFAETPTQHERNRQAFIKAQNERGIR